MTTINPFPQAPWFEIDEDAYLMYLLKGYEIVHDELFNLIEFTIDGKPHREDGPAVIYSDGDEWYYLNNNYYSNEDYNKALENGNY